MKHLFVRLAFIFPLSLTVTVRRSMLVVWCCLTLAGCAAPDPRLAPQYSDTELKDQKRRDAEHERMLEQRKEQYMNQRALNPSKSF